MTHSQPCPGARVANMPIPNECIRSICMSNHVTRVDMLRLLFLFMYGLPFIFRPKFIPFFVLPSVWLLPSSSSHCARLAGMPGTGKTASVRQVVLELRTQQYQSAPSSSSSSGFSPSAYSSSSYSSSSSSYSSSSSFYSSSSSPSSSFSSFGAFEYIELNCMKLPEPHHVYSMLWKEVCRRFPAAAKLAGLATTSSRYFPVFSFWCERSSLNGNSIERPIKDIWRLKLLNRLFRSERDMSSLSPLKLRLAFDRVLPMHARPWHTCLH